MRSIGRIATLAIVLAMSVNAAACTSGNSSAASTSQSSTPRVSASPSAPPLVQEGGAPLGPGTYTTAFRPKITFTTEGSWVSYADSATFVQFERADGKGGISFKRIDKVFDPANTHHLMPAPKDYVTWITTLPGVKVLAGPTDVTIDGRNGNEIDVQATTDAPTIYCKDPCVALWPLDPGHPAALTTDGVARIVALRLGGETVTIGCGAPKAEFKAVANDFDAMLATVRFG